MTEPDILVANGVPPASQPVPEGENLGPPAPSGLALSGTPDPILAMIERVASDPSIDLDRFQQLIAMRERMEDRRAKQAFDAAISLAKGEIGPIIKNREVDFTSSKGRTHYRHEDFAEVARTVDPVLARHGLSYRFRSVQEGAKLKITCRVSHRDGYAEETTLEGQNDTSGSKNDIQAVGSAATYLQRYTLKLALGLAASGDDDSRAVAVSPRIDADQLAYIDQQLRDSGSDVARFLEKIGAASLPELTVKQYQDGLDQIREKQRRAGQKAAP